MKKKKIFISHDPDSEDKARKLAKALKKVGFDVIVAADVRCAKYFKDASDQDKKRVKKAIESCDIVVVAI